MVNFSTSPDTRRSPDGGMRGTEDGVRRQVTVRPVPRWTAPQCGHGGVGLAARSPRRHALVRPATCRRPQCSHGGLAGLPGMTTSTSTVGAGAGAGSGVGRVGAELESMSRTSAQPGMWAVTPGMFGALAMSAPQVRHRCSSMRPPRAGGAARGGVRAAPVCAGPPPPTARWRTGSPGPRGTGRLVWEQTTGPVHPARLDRHHPGRASGCRGRPVVPSRAVGGLARIDRPRRLPVPCWSMRCAVRGWGTCCPGRGRAGIGAAARHRPVGVAAPGCG